jgi:outer membrane usher protein
VPGLLPYQANAIEVDPTEMSLDAEFSKTRIDVTPYARSGALVDFEVRQSRGALVELVQANGSVVPAGARVRLSPGGMSFMVAKRGEVYMTGLQASNSIEVSWPGSHCSVHLELPAGGEVLPRIGPLACLAGEPK